VDDSTSTPAAEVAYENIADEESATKALDFYQRRELQVEAFETEGVVSAQVWGTCPRCGHDLDVQMTLSTVIATLRGGYGLWKKTATQRAVSATPDKPDTVEVACGCGRTHPGAPDQVTGCGVSFRLPTAPPDPASPS
jgi:hypothetical protein